MDFSNFPVLGILDIVEKIMKRKRIEIIFKDTEKID